MMSLGLRWAAGVLNEIWDIQFAFWEFPTLTGNLKFQDDKCQEKISRETVTETLKKTSLKSSRDIVPCTKPIKWFRSNACLTTKVYMITFTTEEVMTLLSCEKLSERPIKMITFPFQQESWKRKTKALAKLKWQNFFTRLGHSEGFFFENFLKLSWNFNNSLQRLWGRSQLCPCSFRSHRLELERRSWKVFAFRRPGD